MASARHRDFVSQLTLCPEPRVDDQGAQTSAFSLYGADAIATHSSTQPRPSGFQSQIIPTACNDRGSQTPNDSGVDSPHNLDLLNRQSSGAGPGELPKARRVRTGCRTCRERHLKCDEALPRCFNCRRSDRVCKRGLRLNFIDTQTVAPPHSVAHPPGTQVSFKDESRCIASEYLGGSERYLPLEPLLPYSGEKRILPEFSEALSSSALARPSFADPRRSVPIFPEPSDSEIAGFMFGPQDSHPGFTDAQRTAVPFHDSGQREMQPQNDSYLHDPEHVFLMQVFVEEVGLWMDSMDPMKHVGLNFWRV